jgi:hypothetical protein
VSHARPAAEPSPGGFVLYVEGPRDRDLLRTWAQRVSPALARGIATSAVILGGRQPARAVAHFRELRERGEAARGLCVLDRDGEDREPRVAEPVPGLAFFTWRRRHIESYLLVPDAIRRSARAPADVRAARSLRAVLPELDDEAVLEDVDAKRLLARHGPLEAILGPLSPGRIARSMRVEELHADVRELFERVREGLGLPAGVLHVTLR